jgi:hypothetical protein
MKYLKYFESSEDEFTLDQRNALIDEIKYYFTDLEDVGCNIRLTTGSKLVQSKSSDLTHFDFNMVNFIKVRIMKNPIGIGRTTQNHHQNQLKLFMISDLFNEVIDVAKDRLSDKNLFIDDDSIQVESSYITMNIYRNEDMDKIKKS